MARRRVKRPLGKRPYRKLFVVATEGKRTEPEYLRTLNSDRATVHVKLLESRHGSAPKHVLQRLQRHLKKVGLKRGDEAWLVVDRDQWPEPQLRALHEWAREDRGRGLAVSNPQFEYWLLLHFEDGAGVAGARDCMERLKRHLPSYDKSLAGARFTRDQIEQAIQRAKQHDVPPCRDWPDGTGSTVYRLVERILAAARDPGP